MTFYSCNDNEFKEGESGLKYKVLTESESKIEISEGDYVELKLNYKTENDSILFNSEEFSTPFKMQLGESSHLGGSFEDAISIMNPGDRYQFIISADSFYYKTKQEKLPDGVREKSNLLFDIQIIRKINIKDIEKERAQLEEQMKEQEPRK